MPDSTSTRAREYLAKMKRLRPCPASATRPDVYVEVVGPGEIVRCPSCGRKTHMTHLGYLYPHMALGPDRPECSEDAS